MKVILPSGEEKLFNYIFFLSNNKWTSLLNLIFANMFFLLLLRYRKPLLDVFIQHTQVYGY